MIYSKPKSIDLAHAVCSLCLDGEHILSWKKKIPIRYYPSDPCSMYVDILQRSAKNKELRVFFFKYVRRSKRMTPKSVSKISFPVNVAVVVRDCVGGSGDGGAQWANSGS